MKKPMSGLDYVLILVALIGGWGIGSAYDAMSEQLSRAPASHTRGLVHIDPEKNTIHARAFFFSSQGLAIKNDTVYAREYILTRGKLEIRNDTIFAYDFILSDGRAALVNKEQWMGSQTIVDTRFKGCIQSDSKGNPTVDGKYIIVDPIIPKDDDPVWPAVDKTQKVVLTLKQLEQMTGDWEVHSYFPSIPAIYWRNKITEQGFYNGTLIPPYALL